jgi:hypothetical protein
VRELRSEDAATVACADTPAARNTLNAHKCRCAVA